nr:hypothetical protein [uncultured Butyrivibrio sp.]
MEDFKIIPFEEKHIEMVLEYEKELKAKNVSLLIALMANNDEAQRFYKSVEGASIHDQGIWMDI